MFLKFSANVEVYDPQKDEWEDGISLTSGRSGLASAVIFQPSCAQSFMDYMPVCPKSEYDDEHKRKPFGDKDRNSSGHGGNASTSCTFSNIFAQNRHQFRGASDGIEEVLEEIVVPNSNLMKIKEENFGEEDENSISENSIEHITEKPNESETSLNSDNSNNLLVEVDCSNIKDIARHNHELVDIQPSISKAIVRNNEFECPLSRFRRLGRLIYTFVKNPTDRRNHCHRRGESSGYSNSCNLINNNNNSSDSSNLPPTNLKRCCIISKFKCRNRNRFLKI